ncbi:MAG TPA: LON peptidase substrate-binding domain-containing protein [Thermoanaerobaculia bacterium]|jgi:Lon protease-like protein|nr:LON peptidase substrate-binding domain-containing protein [Thermoanaerobaculia bacterium]
MPATTLPEIIPVFPLTGSLLLPGNLLPLNIFEPRYRNMVADALEGGQYIGMVQPLTPRQDNWVKNAEDPDPDNPEIYRIGCLGRIEECELQDDGRYLIILRGLSRFRIREELSRPRGYRRVLVEYTDFQRDLDELNVFLNPSQMMRALRAFGDKHDLEFDYDLLSSVPGISLLNGLSVALPFGPAEKQALLEAADPAVREELLLTLMGMGIEPLSTDEYYSPPVLN